MPARPHPRPPRALAAPRPQRRATVRLATVRLATVLGAAVALAACGGEPTAAARAADPAPSALASRSAASAEQRDLATLRAATARFHRYAVAEAARYDFLFLNMCMEDASGGRGGMGNHWVNVALLDGTVDVATPEALLYEPGPDGQQRLVGVEYVIPRAAWSGAEPPRLFGRDFTLNAFDLWALHVWVWKDNPSGLYADWNPRVSCAAAPAAGAGAHH